MLICHHVLDEGLSSAMNDQTTRTYSSPLRESQARQTRDLILDALTELLSDRRADEIATREIADRAGVAQPTVYRHFPDREALIEGVADRFFERSEPGSPLRGFATLDDAATVIESFFEAADEFAVEATADALLNADPRRFSQVTRQHSDQLQQAVAVEFAQLEERTQVQLAALIRCLGSAQTWLRMREEYDVPGVESGPVVAWAIDTLLREVRNGNLPESLEAPDTPEARAES